MPKTNERVLDLSLLKRDGVCVIRAEGEINNFTASRLRGLVVELVAVKQHRIVLDLRRVSFIDSSGLGVIVGVYKRLKAWDGDFALAISPKQAKVINVFEITGLIKTFTICSTQAAAIRAIKNNLAS
jgi:anti-sigma B factor antagonist